LAELVRTECILH